MTEPSGASVARLLDPIALAAAASLALAVAGCGGGSSRGAVAGTAPGAPTLSSVTAGDTQITVSFIAPGNSASGAIQSYTATCSAIGVSVSASASASPIVVTGLSNGTSYSCAVTAMSAAGTGAASASASATPAATTASSGRAYTAAAAFADRIQASYRAATLTPATGFVTRAKLMLSDAATAGPAASYLTIGPTWSASAGYTAISATLTSSATYYDTLSKVVEPVADADSACSELRSYLHPNDSLDVDASNANTLVFRNNHGKAAVAHGYVCLAYDPVTHLLSAVRRYAYDIGSYTHSLDTAFALAGYYVAESASGYRLVANAAQATPIYLVDSPLSLDVPDDFTPGSTAYVANAPAPFFTAQNSGIEGSSGLVHAKVASKYQAQVAQAGTSAGTRSAAAAELAAISTALATQGARMRYDAALYLAFRDSLLASTLASDGISDGTPGQNLVPYVYFTNEADSSGTYHPFMVIVGAGNGGAPHGLLDVPRPPGVGNTSGAGAAGAYESQTVTRNANLDFHVTGIPLRDYGLTDSLTGNVLARTLLSDAGTGGAATVYNYASTADNGILVNGAAMFPVDNNALVPSQSAGELTGGGCHVGGGGGGPHCHADGYASGGILGVYADSDYATASHPPVIGFGYDGVALFARYRGTRDGALPGYATPLDAYGGHDHDGLGYHYHADNGVAAQLDGGASYTLRSLIRGAYRGNINGIPFFRDNQPDNPYFGGCC